MASILKVDEMQGVTSAGDITITSEGGSATQSLQQGLAKSWNSLASVTSVDDSLNVSSLVDEGSDTPNTWSLNMTNAMSSNEYTVSANAEASGSNNARVIGVAYTSSSKYLCSCYVANSPTSGTGALGNSHVLGDLA